MVEINKLLKFSPGLPPIVLLDSLEYKEDEEKGDLNLHNRFNAIKELYRLYSKDDKTLIKFILNEEIKYAQNKGYGYGLILVSFMLYMIMDVSDVTLLYDAKFNTCYDARFALDIELIFGLDLEETKSYYLKNPNDRDIVSVLDEYSEKPYKNREDYIKYFSEKRIPYLINEKKPY